MSEAIGVTYLYIPDVHTYHMALWYDNGKVDDDPDKVHEVIEVGPQRDMGQLGVFQMFGEAAKEAYLLGQGINGNTGSPFGFIVGGIRNWSTLPPQQDDKRPSE